MNRIQRESVIHEPLPIARVLKTDYEQSQSGGKYFVPVAQMNLGQRSFS
jgi:hypothetical protein